MLLMLRHLPLLLSCCAFLLPGACSKEESALLPGEIVVNASELPGPIMEWELTLTSERILTVNLDNPLLPWSRVREGLQKAYERGVSDIRQRRAFIFLVEDEVPCGEVFDYLNAIDGKDTLVGVTFSYKNE